MQRPEIGITKLGGRRNFPVLILRAIGIPRCIMYSSQSKGANTGLPQLCQACRHEATIPLTGSRGIKQIPRLNKQVNPLPHSKIGSLLESVAQSLLAFFALARTLTKRSRAKMIISSQNDRHNPIAMLLLIDTGKIRLPAFLNS